MTMHRERQAAFCLQAAGECRRKTLGYAGEVEAGEGDAMGGQQANQVPAGAIVTNGIEDRYENMSALSAKSR